MSASQRRPSVHDMFAWAKLRPHRKRLTSTGILLLAGCLSMSCLHIHEHAPISAPIIVSVSEIFQPTRLEAQDQNAMMLFQQASHALRMRQHNSAKKLLRSLLDDHPKSPLAPRAKMELARIHRDLRENDEAIRLYSELADSKDNRADVSVARNELLTLLYNLQRFRDGVDKIEAWRADNRSDIELSRQLARFYLQSGRGDEARLLLENILEQTADAEVFQDLLKLAIKSGEIEALRNTIERRQARYRTSDFLTFTTDCLLAANKHGEAAELLRSHEDVQQNVALLEKLAQIESNSGDFTRALKTFRRLAELTPGRWEIRRGIGTCLLKLGKEREAIDTWREQVVLIRSLENFQRLADVLIENKLYEEALLTFDEARHFLGNPTQFAEEKCGVFTAMGRTVQAREELLLVMGMGIYKAEMFEKLYQASLEGYPLEERLQQTLSVYDSLALRKALLEYYVQQGDQAAIPRIIALDRPGSAFDELLYERLRQEVLHQTNDFYHALAIQLIQRQRASTLAFRLALLLLHQPEDDPARLQAVYQEAELLAGLATPPDISLHNELLCALAEFVWREFSDVQQARTLLQQVIAAGSATLLPGTAFHALLTFMRLEAVQENFPAADQALQQAEAILSKPDFFAVDIGRSGAYLGPALDDLSFEGQPRILYEKAWLSAHKGDFQDALNTLKTLVEDYDSSLWVDDGLALALQINQASVGNLDHLAAWLRSQRLFQAGQASAAVALLEELAQTASGTPLLLDAAAEALLMSEHLGSPTSLLAEVKRFIAAHPEHWRLPDLWMLQWRLLQRQKVAKHIEAEHLKAFIDRFPSDLRARDAQLALTDLLRRTKESSP